MRYRLIRALALAICLWVQCEAQVSAQNAVNVTQHHNHLSRDGLYIDPAFTDAAAGNLTRDTSFNGAVTGQVYAQPLYIEGGPNGQALVIAVTESNYVCTLDARTGNIVWQRQVGAPVPLADMPCGNIDPLGITGTPVVDLPSRSLFFDAETTPDGGTTKEHLIFSLNVDTGTINSGWPVNVSAVAVSGSDHFNSSSQNDRGALAIINGNVYVPYGGLYMDCSNYNGWIVGMPVSNPATVWSWATTDNGGGAWAVGGVASDGVYPYLATGNTFNAYSWSGGEAIIRFQTNLVFSGATNDYWAPGDWSTLDTHDTDLGGSGPLLVTVPGASPSNLLVALGKDGNAYLINRTNLGGITTPLASANLSSSPIIQAAATYQTKLGTYVVFRGNSTELIAFRITPTSPPTIVSAWSASEGGKGSPFVTSTDGTNNVVVWGIGTQANERLYGFDGDTGDVVYSGGGPNELMGSVENFNTGIVARGRVYVAGDGRVYAFTVPIPQIVLTNLSISSGGVFAFNFTNTPGLSFSVYTTNSAGLQKPNWPRIGTATEISPGQFRYTQTLTNTSAPQFFQVTSP